MCLKQLAAKGVKCKHQQGRAPRAAGGTSEAPERKAPKPGAFRPIINRRKRTTMKRRGKGKKVIRKSALMF